MSHCDWFLLIYDQLEKRRMDEFINIFFLFYKTGRFHVAVCLFGNRSLFFLITYWRDLWLNCCRARHATWNLIVKFLATGQVDVHCKIKETLLIRDWQWETSSLLATYMFPANLTRSVYFHLLFHCHYLFYLVLFFVFKFNCILGNRYFWRCMLEHTKRQVHKWKFLQHALSRYVYNRSLFVIFAQ